jgi:hypothetical protein
MNPISRSDSEKSDLIQWINKFSLPSWSVGVALVKGARGRKRVVRKQFLTPIRGSHKSNGLGDGMKPACSACAVR